MLQNKEREGGVTGQQQHEYTSIEGNLDQIDQQYFERNNTNESIIEDPT
jgi:hypothetical protein